MLYLIVLGAIAGALIVSGCSSDDESEPIVRHTIMDASQEVPPTPSAATGTVTLTISADRTRIDYVLVLVPPFTSPVILAHIHVGPPGVNGPVILFFCTNQAPPPNVPRPQACPPAGGTITGTLTAADLIPAGGVMTFADALAQIVGGNTYSNVHTERFPGGEIRGQNPG
jgi:hypothetical protein